MKNLAIVIAIVVMYTFMLVASRNGQTPQNEPVAPRDSVARPRRVAVQDSATRAPDELRP